MIPHQLRRTRYVTRTSFLLTSTLALLSGSAHAGDPKPLESVSEATFESNYSDSVDDVAICPDGSCFAGATGDHSVKVWDAKSGKLIAEGPVKDGLSTLDMSADGKTIAYGTENNGIVFWDWKTKKTRKVATKDKQGKMLPVRAVAFSPNGTTLVAATYEKEAWLIDVKAGKIKKGLQAAEGALSQLLSARYAANGTKFVIAGRGGAHVFEADGNYIGTWPANLDVADADLTSDGWYTAVAELSSVKVFAADKPGPVRKQDMSERSKDLIFLRDPRYLAVATSESGVVVMDHKTGNRLYQFQVKDPTKLALSRDGKRLAVGALHGHAYMLELPADVGDPSHTQRLKP